MTVLKRPEKRIRVKSDRFLIPDYLKMKQIRVITEHMQCIEEMQVPFLLVVVV